MRLRGYGIPHWPAAPHFLRTPGGHTLIEFPVSVGRCCGVPLPAGGGYFRLAPRWAIDRAFPCLPTGMAGPLFSPEPQASALDAWRGAAAVAQRPIAAYQGSACAAPPSSTPPLVLYCHPQEFDPEGLRALGPDVHVPWRLRWHQGWGRRAYEEKVGALLSRIPFRPVRDLLPLGTRGSPRP
jgi:hypothetical protein